MINIHIYNLESFLPFGRILEQNNALNYSAKFKNLQIPSYSLERAHIRLTCNM